VLKSGTEVLKSGKEVLKTKHESTYQLDFDDNHPYNTTTTMAKKKKEKETWSNSNAKQLLKDDILTGRVLSSMGANDVYQMREEFKKYKIQNFTQNLKTLRDAIARDLGRMCRDCEYYGHDLGVLTTLRANDPPGPIEWHKSEAKPLLKNDIKNKVHLTITESGTKITPMELYQTRVEYRAFSLQVFRNHIYQELKKLEKIESNIRFGKKKKRQNPAAAAAAPQLMEMIDQQG
jgi:hypothetical protein